MSAAPQRGWSIVLATYNGARWLPELLASLQRQSRQPAELVVVDDASDDESPRLVAEFAATAGFPCRLVRQEVNGGSLRAFERGLALATGSAIALADQDDVWRSDKLAKLDAALESAPGAYLAFSDARVVDAGGEPLGYTAWETDQVSFPPSLRKAFADPGVAFRHLRSWNVVTGATAGFRAELRDLALPFPAVLDRRDPVWQIHDGWLALMAAALGPLAIIEEPLVDYRSHGAQQVGLLHRSTQPRPTQRDLNLDVRIRNLEPLVQRLQSAHAVFDAQLLAGLEDELRMLRRRKATHGTRLSGLPRIAHAIRDGDYARHGRPRDVAVDLVRAWQ